MGNDLRTVLVISLENLLKLEVVSPSEIKSIVEMIMRHYSLPAELYQHCVSVVSDKGYNPKNLPKHLINIWENARQELRMLGATSCRVVNYGKNLHKLCPGRYNGREVFDERVISEETVYRLKEY
jgi:hypothetical protein